MIEIPEAAVLAGQIRASIGGKTVIRVIANQSPHRFAWFTGDPEDYSEKLLGKTIGRAVARAGQIEIEAQDMRLLFAGGVLLRYHAANAALPKKHQLLIEFGDSSVLSASVVMYGGLWCFPKGQNHNPYYLASCEKPSPLSKDFDREYFETLLEDVKISPKRFSLKAFLATDQRTPGLGNGVLQDILYVARLHPKRNLDTLCRTEKTVLFDALKSVLHKMERQGGRDTEKDLHGQAGGYRTLLSRNTVGLGCPDCGSVIKKQAYMGGSIYWCDGCQQL